MVRKAQEDANKAQAKKVAQFPGQRSGKDGEGGEGGQGQGQEKGSAEGAGAAVGGGHGSSSGLLKNTKALVLDEVDRLLRLPGKVRTIVHI